MTRATMPSAMATTIKLLTSPLGRTCDRERPICHRQLSGVSMVWVGEPRQPEEREGDEDDQDRRDSVAGIGQATRRR